MATYVDSSAIVKLIVREPESDALRAWLIGAGRSTVSCDLARTEVLRAVRRTSPHLMVQARSVLETLDLVEVTTATFESAARLDPPGLRTLDAVHLAAALDLADDLEGLVTYDDRLAAAASLQGIAVIAPE